MEDENTVWHAVLNQANTDKKKLHLYEQQSQYHPQKNEESHKLPAKKRMPDAKGVSAPGIG